MKYWIIVLLLSNIAVGLTICSGNRNYYDAVSSGCTRIPETLSIRNTALKNLDALVNVTFCGCLIIRNNTMLKDIDGLSGLTSVGENINIYENDALVNVDGLSNVSSIGGNLYIYRNGALVNVEGLSNVSSINGNIKIYENDALVDVDGLSNVPFVGGNLEIYRNGALVDVNGLLTVSYIGGNLFISDNDIIQNLDGLQAVTSIGGNLYIVNNTDLIQIEGIINLETIRGSILIEPLPFSNCSIDLKNMFLNVANYTLNCSTIHAITEEKLVTIQFDTTKSDVDTINESFGAESTAEIISDPTNICDLIACIDPIIQDIQYNDTIIVTNISLTIGDSTSFLNGLKLTNSTLVIKSAFTVKNRCLEISDNVHVEIDLEKSNSRENQTIITYDCHSGEFESFTVTNGDTSCSSNLEYTENQLTLFYTNCTNWWITLIVVGSVVFVLVVLTMVIIFSPTVRNTLLPYRYRRSSSSKTKRTI